MESSMDKFFEKPQKIFLIFALFWGLVFALFNPPFQAPDEPEHLFKMWGITQGSLNFKKLTVKTSEQKTKIAGQILPKGLIEAGQKTYNLHFKPNKKTSLNETKEIIKIKLEKENPIFLKYPIPSYTPISYLPTLFFIWILSWFHATPFLMLITSRICSLITYIFLTYHAIKITPIKKWLFLVLALMPMCIYEASACSTDALSNGTALLFIAYTLNLAYNKKIEKIGYKENIIFFSLIAILSICKFAYLPMLFLYLIIPTNKFNKTTNKLKCFIILAFTVSTITIGFLLSHFLLTKDVQLSSFHNMDVNLIFLTAITHPIQYILLIIKTLIHNFYMYLTFFVGTFGWLDTPLPPIAVFSYILLLIVHSLNNENIKVKNIKTIDKLMFATVCICCTFLICSACYLIFWLLPNNTINGIQGRYFIPYILLFFLLFNNTKFDFEKISIKMVSIILINLILFSSIIRIIYRFYI